MGRKKGTPAYEKKVVGPSTYITTKIAAIKLKGAERRSGKSASDCLTHCILQTADSITKDTFAEMDAKHAAAKEAAAK